MIGRYLTRAEVQLFEGKSERWVKDNAERLGVIEGDIQPNGKPEPLYHSADLSIEGQMKYLEAKVAKCEEAKRARRQARDLTLSTRELAEQALELSEQGRRRALHRYEVIRPLLAGEMGPGERRKIAAAQGKAAGVSWRTVYRWIELYKGEGDGADSNRGLEALARRARSDRGKAKTLNEAARELLIALMTPNEKRGPLSPALAFDEYKAERAVREELWRLGQRGRAPSLDAQTRERLQPWLDEAGMLRAEARLPKMCVRTFRNHCSKIPKQYLELARMGPDAHDKRHLVIVSRNYEQLAPLEMVVMDHRKLDVLCILPPAPGQRGGPRLGRPWLTAAIDMRTRRWLAWTVGAGANSAGIVSVVRQVVETFGRPPNFYWDNGQDFDSNWLESIVEALGSKVTHALPENARAKNIEPNFKRIAAKECLLPEWLGHKPEVRPERITTEAARWEKAQKQDAEYEGFLRPLHSIVEFYQALLERLNDTPMQGEGMQRRDASGHWRPQTPLAIWSEVAAGVTFEKVRLADLLFLLQEPRAATVRQGEISITYHGKTVRYRAEGDPLALARLNGRRVRVMLDRYDLRRVAVFDDDIFITMAAAKDRRKFGEDDFQIDLAIRQRQARLAREQVKAVRSISIREPSERLLEEAEAVRRRAAEMEPARKEVTVAMPGLAKAVNAREGGDATPRPVEVVRPDDGGDGDDGGDFDWRRM